VNHKDNKGAFVTRCTVWNPEITYTLRELADALHVVPVGSDDTSPQDELVHGEIHAGRDALGLTEQRWVEKMVMKHHPLLAAMTAMGHVYSVDKKPCRNPIYIVKCPNSHNHSDPSDDKAKLQITTGQAKASWFFCHHAHCQGLGYKDLLEAYAGFGVKPDCDFDWLLKKNLAQYAMVGTRIRDIFHTADRPATDPTYDPEVFRNMWKRHQKILNIDGANGKKKQIVIQMYDSWLKGCDAYTGEIFRPDLPDLCVAGQLNTHRMSYRFPSGRPEPRHVDLLKELVYGLVNQDERTAEWLLKWISIKLSHLEARLPGVIFFSETQGHGKTTLGSVVRVVLGANYVVQTFGKMVAPGARFNKCQETAAILELNEVHPPHGHATPGVRRAIYSHLKRLNDPTIDGVVEIEGKGVDSKMAKAFSSVWIMGNDKYEPAIDPNDRRYTAIETVKFAPEGHRIWRDLERELTINRVPFGNSLYNWAVANSEGQRSIEVLDTPYLRELKARGFGDEVTDKAEEIANEFKTLSAKIGG
jgi:hypothetical protein